jgi:predicted O-methyltransferase YrrM
MHIDWAHYHTISALVNNGQHAEALETLHAFQVANGGLAAPYVVLRAQALGHIGKHHAASDALEGVVAGGNADFWIWYTLAEARRALGDWPGVFAASREAHLLAGWPESGQHGYRFTHDYFAANLLTWQAWFAQHITAAPIRALEIGSWQGGSACWLLDRVVGPRGGTLTCIDPFSGSSEHAAFLSQTLADVGSSLEALFDDNVARTGHAGMVRKLKGFSQDVLPRLHGETFDFIYVDGAHEAKWVIQDAVLSWGVLAPGGFMLFDDVPFTFPERPEQNTARAIDFFTSVFRDDLTIIASERQLLLRRHA